MSSLMMDQESSPQPLTQTRFTHFKDQKSAPPCFLCTQCSLGGTEVATYGL